MALQPLFIRDWKQLSAYRCPRSQSKHSIASEAFCMNQVTFALQNIKIRLWYFT